MPEQDRQPLIRYLTEQMKTDRELNRVLELAARQSSARIRQLELTEGTSIGDRVRAAQYRSVIAAISEIQQDTWVAGVGPIIQRSFPRAQRAAEASFRSIEKALIKSVGRKAAMDLIESSRKIADRGIEIDRLRRARQLSPKVYKNRDLARGAVERTIRAGIIQGLSAKELAENVKRFISPRVRGGVSYAALRLARTELNNAFHEAQKLEGASQPFVKGGKWNLSGSHPNRDVCNELAERDKFGMGAGIYPADKIPDKPHPQCLCFMTWETLSEAEMLKQLPRLLREAG
jgi:hypothetical protein